MDMFPFTNEVYELVVSFPRATSRLSRRTGISRNTIFDWHKKNTNPGSDKIMAICRALEITLEQLLTGEGIDDVTEFKPITDRTNADRTDAKLLEDYHGMQDSRKKRLLAYVEALKKIRGQQVMFDQDLATIYGYELKRLNEQVKRNIPANAD